MSVAIPYIASCGCVVKSGERCKHMIVRDRERKARFDLKRPSAGKRGYGAKWRHARNDYLKDHPVCVMCGAPATLVDHKTPHKGDLKLFWSRSNWQSLCTTCHSIRKQRIERNVR